MNQQDQSRGRFSHSDCEKELIRKGESSARAAEICKGKGEGQREKGGEKSWKEEENERND